MKDFIPELARLRIEVFAEYPFLYNGDYENEMKYLNKFLSIKDAIIVGAFDEDRVVGLSTGYPFINEAEELQQVFLAADKNPKEYFCFAESVLKKEYRGLGIGSKFFDLREDHARQLNELRSICFYTALRPENDPKRPVDYRSLAPFWGRRGFKPFPELVGSVSYKEIGEEIPTPKQVMFWIKSDFREES